MLVLLFVALWFVLRGDLLYVFPCIILFLCFSVLLVLRLPRLGKRELILVLSYVCSDCACLDLSVSSSSWGLGRAAVCDCGTPWTFLLPFLTFHANCLQCQILLAGKNKKVSSNILSAEIAQRVVNVKGTSKLLLRQGYRYFKLRKAFSKFYRRHSALLEKYSVSLKTLLQQGISEPGDLVYRFRKL